MRYYITRAGAYTTAFRNNRTQYQPPNKLYYSTQYISVRVVRLVGILKNAIRATAIDKKINKFLYIYKHISRTLCAHSSGVCISLSKTEYMYIYIIIETNPNRVAD